MKALRSTFARVLLVPLVVATLASPGVFAQQPAAPAPGAASQAPVRTFSQQELDQLLAPIALYPDALVAQVLMASTYPLQVVEAARWSRGNPAVKDKALEDAMLNQPWEPAVKSLTSVPQVLQQMDQKIDWTQKLGEAFLAQQADVMKTVQALRAKAYAAGNLKSTQQQVVKTEGTGSQTIYIVESAKPTVVYVPTYNPYTVYGTWWYPAPPYYMYPPAYVYPPGVAFATGVVVGAAIWGNTNWHGNSVTVNVNQYNSYNKTTITSSTYNYNKATVNQATVNQATVNQAQKNSVQSQAQAQGVTKSSAQAQAQAQGISQNSVQSQAQAQGVTKSSAQSQAQAARGTGAGSPAGMSASGLSGAGTGGGAATREASARGGSSRAMAGGGGGRGGRR
jgi:hypothetical protein